MDDSWQKQIRKKHKDEAFVRLRTLLKCLQDPILSEDSSMVSKLVKELEEHCWRAGLIESRPSSLSS
jgi:hypothetical protein